MYFLWFLGEEGEQAHYAVAPCYKNTCHCCPRIYEEHCCSFLFVLLVPSPHHHGHQPAGDTKDITRSEQKALLSMEQLSCLPLQSTPLPPSAASGKQGIIKNSMRVKLKVWGRKSQLEQIMHPLLLVENLIWFQSYLSAHFSTNYDLGSLGFEHSSFLLTSPLRDCTYY